MRLFFAFFLILIAGPVTCQNFIEDFESGNLFDWDLNSGIADFTNRPIVEGNTALRLWNRKDLVNPEAILIHKTFQEDFGIYSFYAWGEGPDSEADFYFHYQDENNYYQVSHKPAGTNKPEFIVSKVVNGIYTELYSREAVEERGKWVYISIERSCTGRMYIGFNNDNVVDLIETDIMVAGSIGLRAWSEFSFFDRIEFEPSRAQVYELDALRCPGQGYTVGTQTYDVSGTYRDTLTNLGGCDSIVQLQLEIVDTIKVELDTILCPGSSITIDNQNIKTAGMFREEYITSAGCDSVILWTVLESPHFSLGPDRAICDNEEVIISAQAQRSYLWNTGTSSSELTVGDEGLYHIEIVDTNNCIQRDTINVVYQCSLEMYAANIFTPNDDTIHDTWQPVFNFLPSDYSLSVFDRWGNLVFSSTDPNESWNGHFENDHAVTGVYYWQIIADAELFSGDVTIIR